MNLSSIVEALRCNSTTVLLGVPDGSNWWFALDLLTYNGDAMEQEVEAEMWKYNISFENIGDPQNQLTITLLEAMRTNPPAPPLRRGVRL